jgi:hypothetical protein
VSEDKKTSPLPDLFHDTLSAGESHGKMNDNDELGRTWMETVRILTARPFILLRYFGVFVNLLGNGYERNKKIQRKFWSENVRNDSLRNKCIRKENNIIKDTGEIRCKN